MKLKITPEVRQKTFDVIDWLEVTRQRFEAAKKEKQLAAGNFWEDYSEYYYKNAFMDYLNAQIEYSHLVLLYFGEEYIEKTRYENNVLYNN